MNRRAYLLCSVPAVFGLLVIVLCFVSLAVSVSDMPRFVAPGERILKLDVGRYILYAESDDDSSYAGLSCNVYDVSGASLKIEVAKYGPSYETLAHSGRSAFDVFVKSPGEYNIKCTMGPGQRGTIAVGRNLGITIMIGVVSLILGVSASLIWAFVIRRRHARGGGSPPTS